MDGSVVFQVGLNPYGLTVSLGLAGQGTPRGSARPMGIEGFVAFGEEIGAKCLEFDIRMLAFAGDGLGKHLRAKGITPIISQGPPIAGMEQSLATAPKIGARLIRMSMTSVLCGDRAATEHWNELVERSRNALIHWAPIARDKGIDFAVENHQDLGSEELLEYTAEAGPNVGICFDTGNPLAVGEDILAFAHRVAPRVRHVHLKDYRAQFTDEGYRLVRCPIGDGCVPFAEIHEILQAHHKSLTASLEPGAMEARHIRLLTHDWWSGYRARSGQELGVAIATARRNRLPEDLDCQTPWEQNRPAEEIERYEMSQIGRSVDNMTQMGWL